jgi:hypothetical protein
MCYRGIPLVTTPSGADGLLLGRQAPGAECPPFLTAASAVSFVDMVVALLSNASLWQAASAAALAHANENFSLAAQAHDLERALNVAFMHRERGLAEAAQQ